MIADRDAQIRRDTVQRVGTGLELMTEEELIDFLRIPEVSKAKNFSNVVENLKRMHDLPRIRICGRPLYPREAVLEWIRKHTEQGNH